MENLRTAQIWSDAEGAVVEWTVAVEPDPTTDPPTTVVVARHGDEYMRFSPTYTDAEFLEYIASHNAEHV